MGFVIRAFLTGVAVFTGMAVGDIISKEITYQYHDFAAKRKEEKVKEIECPDVIID